MTTSRSTFNPVQTVLQESDFVRQICLNLNLQGIAICSLVSKRWQEALQDDLLCERDFNHAFKEYTTHTSVLYKTLYQQFYHQKQKIVASSSSYTLKGQKTYNLQITYYIEKEGRPLFKAVAKKSDGCSLGTIFKKSGKRWLGKVGDLKGILRNDPLSIRSRTKKEINLDTIREKIAYDLYQELGRDLFVIPKTCLSQQPIMDQFNNGHFIANRLSQQGIFDSLRIMSRYIEDYQDFKKAQTLDGKEIILFMEYLKRHHRPPETLLTPQGKLVSLKGVMSLLAVSRCLADTDALGGSGGNAGFTWIYEGQEIRGAQAVKIDPGCSFKFKRDPEIEEEASINLVINTLENLWLPSYHLKDLRDLQTSNLNRDTLIAWSALTSSQREEFLTTLFNASRYLKSKDVLHFLFYREGAFNRSETEMISEKISRSMENEMIEWMQTQVKIYAKDLQQIKQSHPNQLIKGEAAETPLPPRRDLMFSMEQALTISNDGWTSLHAAAYNGHVEMVRRLCDENPPLLQQAQNNGETPLHAAAYNGHVEVVKLLCEKKPFLLYQANNDGETPLHAAAYNGHVEIAKLLCEKNSSLLNQAGNDGWTSLHAAAQNGHIEVVEWLCLQRSWQPIARDAEGRTPFHVAQQFRKTQVMQWLRTRYPRGTQ